MTDKYPVLHRLGSPHEHAPIYAVLDTPCWPCRFYGGPIHNGFPLNNDTFNFKRTKEEALAHAVACFENHKKWNEEMAK